MLDKLLASPLGYILLALAAVFVLSYIYKLLKPKERTAHMIAVKCRSCGWTGSVGRYRMACSKCGSTELLRK